MTGWKLSSDVPAEELPYAELQETWSGFFKNRKPVFTYRKCAECGMVYCPAYFSQEQLSELYGTMADNTAGVDKEIIRATQRGYYKLLKENSAVEGQGYLEFGPDLGLFTESVLKHEAFEMHWLLEPNSCVHPELRRLCEGRDYTILSKTSDVSTLR